MRRTLILMALTAIASMSTSGRAETPTNISGTWTFSDEASKVRIVAGGALAASQLVITQTPAELRIESSALLQKPQFAVYRLDGAETTFMSNGSTTTARATWDGPRLVITGVRRYPGPSGQVSVDLKAVYSLAADRLMIERTEVVQGAGTTDLFVYRKGAVRTAVAASSPTIRRDGGPVPRTPQGKPDMSGYWTGNSRGGLFDIEPHAGSFAWVAGQASSLIHPTARFRIEKRRAANETGVR
jgi:hypothetical protein